MTNDQHRNLTLVFATSASKAVVDSLTAAITGGGYSLERVADAPDTAIMHALAEDDICVLVLDAVADTACTFGPVNREILRRSLEATPDHHSFSMTSWFVTAASSRCRLLPVLLEPPADAAGYQTLTPSITGTESGTVNPGATGSGIEIKIKPVCVRRRHVQHDLELLLARLFDEAGNVAPEDSLNGLNGYPFKRYASKQQLTGNDIRTADSDDVRKWDIEDAQGQKIVLSLNRTFQFNTFASAVNFIDCVSVGCDIADHHPDFAHSYRKLSVSLKTWDAERPCVTVRDVALAGYFERVYRTYFK